MSETERLRAALIGYMKEHDAARAAAMGPEYSQVECDCDLCCAADEACPTLGPPGYAPDTLRAPA